MIVNLPTEENLNNVALRTYFRACSELIDIWLDFGSLYSDGSDVLSAPKDWPDEWKEYLVQAQPDLQAICSLLQQSAELALKARVCGVSPYLLLLNSGMKFSTSLKSHDFSELRTLDAVDLPSAVNTLTDKPVSEEFVSLYGKLRSLRNKVVHLGEASMSLAPVSVLGQAVLLYSNIWPGRKWLSDRLVFAAQTRRGSLHDGKYVSTHMEVLSDWPVYVGLLTKGQFKSLFGYDKSKKRYLCHSCVYEGETRYADLQKPGCGTAFLTVGRNAVDCIMCGETFLIERQDCDHCRSKVVGANGDDWVGYCHTCGEFTEDTSVR